MSSIKAFVFNPFMENTYLIWDRISMEGIIIDPGCSNEREENVLKQFINNNRIQVKYLFLTHTHIDHISGVNFVLKEFNPTYYYGKDGEPLITLAPEQGLMFGLDTELVSKTSNYFSEDLVLFLGKEKILFLHTPGHAPGEFCFYFENSKILISGDVLFNGSIGRTDLWGSNHSDLINAIKTKLFTLPEDVVVYPGHGEHTTIGFEKKHNPFF